MFPLRICRLSRMPLGSRTLAVGDRGDDVRELQAALAHEGFYPLPPDGVFGYVTDEAVRQFQGVNRIRVDGHAGSAVYDALRRRHNGPFQLFVVTSEPSLAAVARKLSAPVGALAQANNLSERALTYRGQRLIIHRRVVGMWAGRSLMRAARSMPPLSLAICPGACLGHSGVLVPSGFRIAEGRNQGEPSWFLVSPGKDADWGRTLVRPDWWPILINQIAGNLNGHVGIVLDVGHLTAPQRRRMLRLLWKIRQHPGCGKSQLMVACSLEPRGFPPAGWLGEVAQLVSFVALQPGLTYGSVTVLDRRLRRILRRVPRKKALLAVTLAGSETMLDDDGRAVDTQLVPYHESQLRASGQAISSEGIGAPLHTRYRMRGHWRELTFLDAQAVEALGQCVNRAGLAGVIFHGLESADSRLLRTVTGLFIPDTGGDEP